MIIDDDLINNFISFKKNEGLKEKTLYRFRYDFKAFHRRLNENNKHKIEEVDIYTIEEYKSYLFSLWGSKYGRYWKQESLSSWTINQKILVIKHFLEYCNYMFDIWIDCKKIKLNKVKYKTWDYFTIEEIKQILEAVEHTEKYKINQLRLQLIIILCFVSGARLNEMRQITIQGVYNLQQKILGKWDKERYLFFNNECIKKLNEYLEEQKKPIPRLWKVLKSNSDYAVIGHWSENFWSQIGKQAITEMFKKLNEYLKRDKHITLHTLRHSYATYMVEHWTNPFYLKELMWHEKLQTTVWYYHRNRNILQNEQKKIFENVCI